jgi:hypothetical protein
VIIEVQEHGGLQKSSYPSQEFGAYQLIDGI